MAVTVPMTGDSVQLTGCSIYFLLILMNELQGLSFVSNTVSLADDLLPWLTHLWF